MEQAITVLGIVLDKPDWMPISDIVHELKDMRINGHQILHARLGHARPMDEIEIPHPGHSVKCVKHITITDSEMTEKCRELQQKYYHQYVRHFNVELIVSGAVRLAEWRYFDFVFLKYVIIQVATASQPFTIEDGEPKPWKELELWDGS